MLRGCVAVVCVKAIEQGMFLFLPPDGSRALPFIAQGRSSGLHGRKRMKRRKRKAEEHRDGSLRGGAVLLLWVGPAGPVVDAGVAPHVIGLRATMAIVARRPPGHGISCYHGMR
jgi:hypothetical protein